MSETEVQTNEGTAQPTAVEQHKQEFLELLRKYIMEYGDESNLVIVMAQTSKGNKTMEFDKDSVELAPALEIIDNLGDSFREESVKLAERSAIAAEQIRKYPSMVKNKGEPQPKNVDSIENRLKCDICKVHDEEIVVRLGGGGTLYCSDCWNKEKETVFESIREMEEGFEEENESRDFEDSWSVGGSTSVEDRRILGKLNALNKNKREVKKMNAKTGLNKNVDSIRTPSGIVEATNLNFMKCKYCESVRCTLIKTTINANPGDSLIVPHLHINIFYRCCGCHKDFVVRMMLGIPEYFDKLFYGDLSNGFPCEHPSGKEDTVINRWEGLRNYIQWYKEHKDDFNRDFLIFSVKKKGDGTIEIEEDDE